MVKLTNPLCYSIAILMGGIVFIAGSRVGKLPNIIILPGAALAATATAMILKARATDPEKSARPEIERELINLKVSSQELALRAGFVRQEASQILGHEAEYLKLLARIEESCKPFADILPKIEELGRKLPRKTAALSLTELEKELSSARALVSSSSGIARQQAEELVTGLERNLELAKTGHSVNLAKLLQLRALVEDAEGLLQELQNKIRTIRRRGVDRVQEIRELCARLKSIASHLDILIL